MKNFKPWFLLGGAFVFATALVANADTLNGTGGAWQTWTAASLGSASSPTYGSPYWNHSSGDGGVNNIGWCLVGGGNCSIPTTPGAIPYFGNGAAAVSTMWFSSGGSGVTVSLQGVFTSQTQTTPVSAGIDYFGYYLADSSGAPISGSTHQLMSAAAPVPTSASFSIDANQNYGFYIENVQGLGGPDETDYWYFMDSASNMASNGASLTSLQHFAIFDGTGSMFMGMEDDWSDAPDADYNDMIVQMTATPSGSAPEPASIALAALGFIAFGLGTRRKYLRRS